MSVTVINSSRLEENLKRNESVTDSIILLNDAIRVLHKTLKQLFNRLHAGTLRKHNIIPHLSPVSPR